jgi:hypothetical protein
LHGDLKVFSSANLIWPEQNTFRTPTIKHIDRAHDPISRLERSEENILQAWGQKEGGLPCEKVITAFGFGRRAAPAPRSCSQRTDGYLAPMLSSNTTAGTVSTARILKR